MDPSGLRVTQNACFSFLTHTKQLLLVTFYNTTSGIEAGFRKHRRTAEEGQRDVEIEIVV